MKSTNYILVQCHERFSHKSLNTYYKLTFLDPDTMTLYECSVDPDMNNWKFWREHLTKPNPLGIYSNLKETTRTSKEGTPVISADSHPHFVETLTQDEVQLLVEVLLKELDN
jgi:hypothetical protein